MDYMSLAGGGCANGKGKATNQLNCIEGAMSSHIIASIVVNWTSNQKHIGTTMTLPDPLYIYRLKCTAME